MGQIWQEEFVSYWRGGGLLSKRGPEAFQEELDRGWQEL